MSDSTNVVQMPGTVRVPEAPKVMTSTAEADINRHLATLEAFKADPAAAVALADRFQKAVVLAGLAFLGAFVLIVVALLAVTLGYLLGGMR